MNQRISTRQLHIPKGRNPITAKELKRAVMKQLAPGEELVQFALTAVEPTHLVVEVGVVQRS